MNNIKSILLVIVLSLSSCGYQEIEPTRIDINNGWREILVSYRERSDLIPHLNNLIRKIDNERTISIEEGVSLLVSSRIRAHKNSRGDLELSQTHIAKLQEGELALGKALATLLESCKDNRELHTNPEFIKMLRQFENAKVKIMLSHQRYRKGQLKIEGLLKKPPLSWINKFFWKYKSYPALSH
ncbi:MAG: hypothetical protein HN509_16475 [Halobacteriovoraceae bacterium]|jgi:LemA protein|nr:hypothetical protein [Halobacteriovoraceae bacterium]MBT5094600.1 hypothetical protein [Halobacteriovoraceae bacterium]